MRRTQAVGQFAVEAPRLSIDEAAERLAAVLERDLDFERAAVVVVADDRPSMFRLVATAGYEQERVEQYREFPVSLGVVGRAYRTGEPQLLETIESDPDYLDVDPTTRSEMAVPLRGRDTVFGVIDVASRRPAAFDADDLRFLETAAAQLGRAFDNARLAEMERQTIRELEELAAMQDDFIAIANHELRTPVTTIAGFAQSLLKQRDVLTQEEVDDAIERIARQSARLRSLIEDLLTAPREGDRGDRIALVPVTLAAVADEVVRELDPDDGRHRFLVRVAPDLPDVQADPEALRRVLTNLVSNAVKYSPEGGAVVVDAEPHPDEPERVRVAVRDEGIGIAPGDVPALFTKFGRIPKAAATSGGMGLGLFIVKELVEGMGGEVGVESAPGRGSCFWFTLDAARRTRPVGV
jgi:signal transduction histidine kinase